MQPDAGHQDRGHRDQRDESAVPRQSGLDDGSFVLAEELLHPSDGDGIRVPGVAGDIGHLFNLAIVGRVKAMIHARRQPQRDVAAVAVQAHELVVDQEILQGIGKTLGLDQLIPHDGTRAPDDGVAGTDQDGRIWVDGPRSDLQLADEAVVQAAKLGRRGVAQIDVGELAPQTERQITHPWILDPGEPPHELGEQAPRDAIGEQEVQVLLLEEAAQQGGGRGRGCGWKQGVGRHDLYPMTVGVM